MATVSKNAVRDGLQGVLEGFAVIEVNAMRQLNAAQQGRAAIRQEWERLDLGDFPEYEPEIRARKVS